MSLSCSIPPLTIHQGVGATELSSPRTSAAAATIATAAVVKSQLGESLVRQDIHIIFFLTLFDFLKIVLVFNREKLQERLPLRFVS